MRIVFFYLQFVLQVFLLVENVYGARSLNLDRSLMDPQQEIRHLSKSLASSIRDLQSYSSQVQVPSVISKSWPEFKNLVERAQRYLMQEAPVKLMNYERRLVNSAFQFLRDLISDNQCEIENGGLVRCHGRSLLARGNASHPFQSVFTAFGLILAFVVSIFAQFCFQFKSMALSLSIGAFAAIVRTLLIMGMVVRNFSLHTPSVLRDGLTFMEAIGPTILPLCIYCVGDFVIISALPYFFFNRTPLEMAQDPLEAIEVDAHQHELPPEPDAVLTPTLDDFKRSYFRKPFPTPEQLAAQLKGEPEESELCPICQDPAICDWNVHEGTEIQEKDKMLWLNSCHHGGHAECLYPWFQLKYRQHEARRNVPRNVVVHEENVNGAQVYEENGQLFLADPDDPEYLDNVRQEEHSEPQPLPQNNFEWNCPVCQQVVIPRSDTSQPMASQYDPDTPEDISELASPLVENDVESNYQQIELANMRA